jgi:hypothetical protein
MRALAPEGQWSEDRWPLLCDLVIWSFGYLVNSPGASFILNQSGHGQAKITK